MTTVERYEKLGAFYLGKMFDLSRGEPGDELLLYDAKDLCTHAVCVGMTGSGKTGLCVSLLEEAAIDGIPAIAIDPKGDLGNLMLTFPKLRAQDFRPWIDESEAARKGMSPDEYAKNRADLWRKGLKGWGQDGSRIERLREAADFAIYTPGSNAGLPLTILRSLTAPPPALVDDAEAMRDRVSSAVSGLLALLGIDADPVRSREHILVSTVVDGAWRAGRDLDIATLIQQIQSPSFDKLGVMDLESFYPAKDRFELALALNSLLASPGFAAWTQGEPLDVSRLLYTESGKPRVSILSISHLTDEERMFFVTILLNEVIAWMRTQPGTGSLRAILYMDEIFGFFPPTANPPSKVPMLTLLKQARAYGLGVVLATQNPVDLDYKGLSNTGTWFLGRLQTERDKLRVIDGLEGAAASAGSAFDRKRMDTLLSGLGSRVFLMNNVHEDEPALFHTRWAMSYLRGPLTRGQISTLMADRKAETPASGPAGGSAPSGARARSTPGALAPRVSAPPPLAPGIQQRYIGITGPVPSGARVVYRPSLVGSAQMHFVRVSASVDEWRPVTMFAPLSEDNAHAPWEDARELDGESLLLETSPDERAEFRALPGAAARAPSYKRWSKAMIDSLYRNRDMTIFKSPEFKAHSEPGEDERDFRIRLRQCAHEKRDEVIEKLHKKYAPKLATLQERVRKAEVKVEKEKEQMKQQGFQTAISLGATVLGAMFGRKTASVGNVGRAATTMRGAGRTARERGDIQRAKEDVASLRQRLADLETEFEEEIEEVKDEISVDDTALERIVIRPRKSDMAAKPLVLAWAPYVIGPDGLPRAAFG